MSAQCPQTLPRKSANVNEGRRKLNVGLTCDFTLTLAWSRGECEAMCEAVTALITQRSQVQILPPLLCDVSRHRRQRTCDFVGPLVISGWVPVVCRWVGSRVGGRW